MRHTHPLDVVCLRHGVSRPHPVGSSCSYIDDYDDRLPQDAQSYLGQQLLSSGNQ